jgi:DeoR family ulaG and ulaABCDEF operon transcriptional repressor
VLADSRKFSIHARNVALPLSRVGTLITDENISDQHARMLENAGVTLRVVSVAGGGP